MCVSITADPRFSIIRTYKIPRLQLFVSFTKEFPQINSSLFKMDFVNQFVVEHLAKISDSYFIQYLPFPT